MVKTERKAPLWLETIVLLVIAVVLAVVIKSFFVQAFYIPSSSMKPGLVVNDRILVQKVSYWFGGSPRRGDVVVFEDPGGWLNGQDGGPTGALAGAMAKIGLYPTGGHLVKRVIGVGGDTVACCSPAGRLEINGTEVEEDDFIKPQPKCDGPMVNACREEWRVTVPEGHLFVMGDNRNASADSSARLCEPDRPRCEDTEAFVDQDLVVGKVNLLVWPARHFEGIGRPHAFDDVPDP